MSLYSDQHIGEVELRPSLYPSGSRPRELIRDIFGEDAPSRASDRFHDRLDSNFYNRGAA